MLLLLKVNKDHTANTTSHLVHQATWLAKIYILCILADLGNLDAGNFHIIVEPGKDRADQALKCCGRRHPGSHQHITGNICRKTADLVATLLHPRCNSTDQCCGGALLLFLHRKIRYINLLHREISGYQTDHRLLCLCHDRNGIQIDRSRKHHTILMVRMIATYLTAPRRTIYLNFLFGRE